MSYAITLTYDDAAFRLQFPFFTNPTTYPEASLSNWFNLATSYVSNYNSGIMVNANRQTALYLMTAHLAALNDTINANGGSATGIVTTARIDKVQITMQPPPAKNQWQYWLNLTPWGQQLLALLQVAAAGGWPIGGLPERSPFRRVGGGFGPPFRRWGW